MKYESVKPAVMTAYGRRMAEEIISKAYWNTAEQWAVINSLRRIARAGMPHACQVIAEENSDWVQTHPTLFEGFGDAAQVMTESCVDRAQYAIDSASLIFAHSVLDEVVYQFCLASAAACPSDWEAPLLNKQVVLKDVKGKSFDDLLVERVEAYLEVDVARDSLLKKADRLFAICHLPDNWMPPDLAQGPVYKYDRERLVRLDDIRHKVVHGLEPLTGLGDFECESFFMQMTVIYWLKMVEKRYGIAVNPAHVLRGS